MLSLSQLVEDVAVRSGEDIRSQPASGGVGIPTVAEILERKIRIRLPEVGKKLLKGASLQELGQGEEWIALPGRCKMPCGLYAVDIQLPDDFIRLVSVRFSGSDIKVTEAVGPESPEWWRQWSSESGIAGCEDRPRAYLMVDGGLKLRLMGSGNLKAEHADLRICRIPKINSEGDFSFPQTLYPELVADI